MIPPTLPSTLYLPLPSPAQLNGNKEEKKEKKKKKKKQTETNTYQASEPPSATSGGTVRISTLIYLTPFPLPSNPIVIQYNTINMKV